MIDCCRHFLRRYILTFLQGIAFCEYVDPSATSIAVEGLDGMELGDKHLKVTRASIGATQAAGLDMGVNAMSMFAKTTSADLETSRVLQLLNMVTPEELMNNDDYEGKLPYDTMFLSRIQQLTPDRNPRRCRKRV